MRIIAVMLSKGGVGKTTTTVNIAHALALAGKNVLVVDLDTQGQVSTSLGVETEIGLAEFINNEASAEEAIHVARPPHLFVLAGGRALAGVKRLISRKDYGGERTLMEALQPLEGTFDYILLDTAPSWDVLNVNALFYAREILAPVSLEVLTLQGLVEFARSVDDVKRHNPHVVLQYVVPTFYDRRVKKSLEIFEQIEQFFGAVICDPIRYNVRLSEAPGHGQSIFEYSPNSTGAADYKALAERILADE
jgi:chromosome partitioning protein